MSRFRTVFGFELSSYLKNKVIIGVTIFLVLASAIMLSFPRFTQGGGNGTEKNGPDPGARGYDAADD